ncbi:MAG: hypothetical protein J6K47_06350 [Clostridia bacterium]|nr:hypothetical protein [Clostridia bacterium]
MKNSKLRFLQNLKKPESSAYGKAQLRGMNNRYSLLSSWDFLMCFSQESVLFWPSVAVAAKIFNAYSTIQRA